jgi:hypothetical protein
MSVVAMIQQASRWRFGPKALSELLVEVHGPRFQFCAQVMLGFL